jgi:hypothetical protein
MEKTPPAGLTASGVGADWLTIDTASTPIELRRQLIRTNFPAQIRTWPNWLNERGKVPLNPKTGFNADPTNRADCSNLDDALANLDKCDGVGLALFPENGLSIIDLDWSDDPDVIRTQENIIAAFPDTYSEVSRGGKGRHIFVGGSIGDGCRTKGIEVYSQNRYMCCTGNVINNVPVSYGQEKLDILVSEMRQRKAKFDAESLPQTKTDEQVIEQASKGANSGKFLKLHYGNWKGDYPSQSEADQAYTNVLGYYSDNKEQVSRLFRASLLAANLKNGKPRYENAGYVNRTVNTAFDRKIKQVDTSALTASLKELTKNITIMPTGIKAENSRISASDLQHKVFNPTTWVVPGILPQGLSILGGRPKLGKSWLALDIAMGVSEGGFTLGNKCDPGDVLYCALEDTERRLQQRLGKIRASGPFPKRLALLTSLARADEGGVAEVRRWLVQANNPRVVVIDTLAKVRPGKGRDEGSYDADYKAVTIWKDLADEFNIAIVLVHHVRKMLADDPLEMISERTV